MLVNIHFQKNNGYQEFICYSVQFVILSALLSASGVLRWCYFRKNVLILFFYSNSQDVRLVSLWLF